MSQPANLKARWDELDTNRSSTLQRARECAALTIPALLPPLGHTENTKLPTPHQGLGARAVNNLAAKLILALFPPNTPIFRLSIDDFTLEKLAQREGARAEVEDGLASIERAVTGEIEASNIRTVAFETARQLIATGNVLLFMPPEGGTRMFRLNQYVIRRNPMGEVVEIITKDGLPSHTIPEEIRLACGVSETTDSQKVEDVYTRVLLDTKEKRWKVQQELNGIVIPKSEGFYPIDNTPWLPLRWSAIPGEHYGRGLVEEYLGDYKSLEGLTKAILKAAAAAAKVVYLVNPNSTTTRKKTLVKAESGDVVDGDAKDVTTLQLDKYADFRVAFDMIKELTTRLSQAFMLTSSIQRNAERVTAEEIRQLAGELEDSLGGTYSVLSQEWQLPLVRRYMSQMEKQNKLPVLPKGIVKPVIITGLQALGRGHDLDRLSLVAEKMSVFGPQILETYMDVGDYAKRICASAGVDSKGLIRTDEQINQRKMQETMASVAQGAAPGAIQEMVKGLANPQAGAPNGASQPQ